VGNKGTAKLATCLYNISSLTLKDCGITDVSKLSSSAKALQHPVWIFRAAYSGDFKNVRRTYNLYCSR